jgi:ABC-type Fe3+ transport system substrate-binding protein
MTTKIARDIRHLTMVLASCALLASAENTRAADVSPDLIAKARQEGQVVYYTDLIIDQIVRPLTAAFEKKYGIKVSYVRGDSQSNSLKLVTEQKAGRMMADVFGMTSGMEAMIQAGIARQFTAVNGEELPPQYRDPDHYWISSNLFILTPGLNTSLVPAAQRPKSYDDLLTPYWKGKIAMKPNDLSGATGLVANVLTFMGEERGMDYLRKLSKQDIKLVNASARAILDQVIAGEYSMALQIFNHHAAISAEKGAPVDWVRLSPVTVTPDLVALTKGSPHPNAGLLFVEFMASKEGQDVFQKANYLPARPDVPPLTPNLIPESGGFKGNVITPAMTAKSLEHWDKVVSELFK